VSLTASVECFSCAQGADVDGPVRENVWRLPGWRVAHSFNSSLPGWLVVVPTRHIEALDELSGDEAAMVGRLLRDVSSALKSVTGCVKTYVILLAEAQGFTHLHIHVVPRMDDLPQDRRGTAIFAYLKEEPLTNQQRDDIGLKIREAMSNG
jgi:diadenosine tetraphosphate (Ap4A) HIT family hydrolase